MEPESYERRDVRTDGRSTNTSVEPVITPESTVADVLERWPQTIHVFLKYKTSCPGCLMASFETLSDTAANYQLPLEYFMGEIRHAIRLNRHTLVEDTMSGADPA